MNRRWLLLLFALIGAAGVLSAQRAEPADTARQPEQVTIDYSETLELIQTRSGQVRKLTGDVQLRQDSVFMYCDSAVIFDSDTRVVAMGNVIIQQGDSISIFADSLVYSGVTRVANLYGEVVLQSGDQKLFTDDLHYDLTTKIATYTSGATLINGETQLTSRRGYYYVDSDQAFFKDSVVVIDPQFNLKADTLEFNTATETVVFLGPTLITNDSTRLYTEAGFYDTANNLAEFTENAQYVRGDQRAKADVIRYDGARQEYSLLGNARFEQEQDRRLATADTIRYNEANDRTLLLGNAHYQDANQEIDAPEILYDAKTELYTTRGRSRISDPPQILEADTVDFSDERGLGLAQGNVVWQDTSADLTIRCARADYNRSEDYLKAYGGTYGRPLLINVLDGDSLFIAADTLLGRRADTTAADSSRMLLAYHDVRIYKSNLQALCDSLSYSSLDSTFRFYRNPVIWSDTSQFTADTVYLEMANRQIDRIYLLSKALIINSTDEMFFNQIQGKNIVAFFTDKQLRRMEVTGNAQSIYYALDDEGAYVGVNETVCSEMVIYWGANKVDRIRFLTQPQGTAHPMGKVNHEELRLEGFRWITDRRPRGVMDLFSATPPAAAPPPAAGNLSANQ